MVDAANFVTVRRYSACLVRTVASDRKLALASLMKPGRHFEVPPLLELFTASSLSTGQGCG
jgi:hypothetical protein